MINEDNQPLLRDFKRLNKILKGYKILGGSKHIQQTDNAIFHCYYGILKVLRRNLHPDYFSIEL